MSHSQALQTYRDAKLLLSLASTALTMFKGKRPPRLRTNKLLCLLKWIFNALKCILGRALLLVELLLDRFGLGWHTLAFCWGIKF
jgi:hypothetical protein